MIIVRNIGLAVALVWGQLRPSLASPHTHHEARSQDAFLDQYDYIIVGAGASGLTVANRLSENPSVSVLVIEAGDFDADEDFIMIPGLAGGAVGTKYDWNISYASSKGVNDRVIPIPLGKVVGGSTKLNRMVMNRGSQSDYDDWADLGNRGWDWAAIFPYFKKTEKFTPPTPDISAEYNVTIDPAAHGETGYVQVTYAPFFWPTTKNMVQAIRELGIQVADDEANGDALGGYFNAHNQDPTTKTRSSAEEAYYNTSKDRKNFHILPGHQVTRILTSKNWDGVKAVGVEFATAKDADKKTVAVKKELILAAGGIHTPQLLQVSGIGNVATLADINVETVMDLPGVGQSFQDHVLLELFYSIDAPLLSSELANNATFAQLARAQYDADRSGPLSTPADDFLAFLPLPVYSNLSSTIHRRAVAQNSSAFLPPNTPSEVAQGYKVEHEVLTAKLLNNKSASLEVIWGDSSIKLGLEQPFSRGTVKAVSSNIFDPPVADPGFLTNPLDIDVLIEGIVFIRKLVTTPAIQALHPVEIGPGANTTSHADLEAYIRSNARTFFHPSGSCKIGSRANGGVVDEELRVHGVKGLRIVDASLIPLLPAAHSMATVYAVAEMAADIIKRG